MEQKIFMLCKLLYFLDKNSKLLVYKQAILPCVDYVSFIQLSCNLGMHKDLLKLQNNVLRLIL